MSEKIITRRMTADIDGEVVLFLIGMRINKLWKIHKWRPVANAMKRMLTEYNVDVRSIRPIEPSLEDVFVTLTKQNMADTNAPTQGGGRA